MDRLLQLDNPSIGDKMLCHEEESARQVVLPPRQ
jgi:hypothetical protein